MPREEGSDLLEPELGGFSGVVSAGVPPRGSGAVGRQSPAVQQLGRVEIAAARGVDEAVPVPVEEEQFTLRAALTRALCGFQLCSHGTRRSAVPWQVWNGGHVGQPVGVGHGPHGDVAADVAFSVELFAVASEAGQCCEVSTRRGASEPFVMGLSKAPRAASRRSRWG